MFADSVRQKYCEEYNNMHLEYPETLDESFKQKSIEIMKENELDITITDRNGSYGNSRVYRIVTGKQIGRASCRERVSSPV